MFQNRIAHLFQGLENWNQWQREVEKSFRELRTQSLIPLNLNLNVWQKQDSILVTFAAPGAKSDEVDINVKGDYLDIRIVQKMPIEESGYKLLSNEIQPLKVEQKLQFPFDLDPQRTTARLAEGVLYIELKRHPDYEAKKIEVTAN